MELQRAAHALPTRPKRRLPLRVLPAMDLPFLVLVLTLVGFGLVMLCSLAAAGPFAGAAGHRAVHAGV